MGLGDSALREELLEPAAQGGSGGHGLGTFLGVFVPCTCTIFGVLVFIRLGYVVGEAGLGMTLAIIGASFALSLLTVVALCALIADAGVSPDENSHGLAGEGAFDPYRDPGVYAALRSSVGPELGRALGAAFYLAFTVNVSFYVLGFAEMVRHSAGLDESFIESFLGSTAPWVSDSLVDMAIGSVALAALALVCSRGVRFSAWVSLAVLARPPSWRERHNRPAPASQQKPN